jgi:hypothetical protein
MFPENSQGFFEKKPAVTEKSGFAVQENAAIRFSPFISMCSILFLRYLISQGHPAWTGKPSKN